MRFEVQLEEVVVGRSDTGNVLPGGQRSQGILAFKGELSHSLNYRKKDIKKILKKWLGPKND